MLSPEAGRQVLELGRHLLTGGLVLSAASVVLAVLGVLRKDRRLVLGARAGFYGLFLLIAGSAGCLIAGFVTGQYDNEYVFNYSERALALPFKFAGLWAGLDGSILFWSLILTAYAGAVALQHQLSGSHPVGRRLEPWVYVVMGSVIFFFLLITQQVTNPFKFMDLSLRTHLHEQYKIPISPGGHLLDGKGLNPQLENYWFAIHPPSLYLGFVGFSVPFAFAIASLISREMGDYWIKVTRRWTMVSWLFLTNGIILGGLWAYEMLGWGGYWAWDPVENASLLPWLTGTAFLHSVMIQERRDMLKAWNCFLVILTFFMTIIATYMTRSGVVGSIHAFSEGTVGPWFIWFMGGVAAVSLFLLFFRLPDLRGKHQLESFLSREAAFYFNNLVLVAIAVAVYFLAMFPKISHDFLARSLSVGPPEYNNVTTPLFAFLVFLTAVGPQIGWVRATPENLQRNFLVPASVGGAAVLGLYGLWWLQGSIPSLRKALFPLFYPTALTVGLAIFVFATVYTEFHRGIKSRVKFRGESFFQAIGSLFAINNRRYGGYVVHVGFGLVVIGVVISSFFQAHETLTLPPETPAKVGDYTVEMARFDPARDQRPAGPGQPYDKEVTRFTIRDGRGRPVVELAPERHYYPKNEPPVVGTPAISRNLVHDFYAFVPANGGRAGGPISFEVFVNPLVNWIWAGWLIMIAGGILAVLPMPARRIGLAE